MLRFRSKGFQREEVGEQLAALVRRTGADELILAGNCFDPAARERSLSLTMEAMEAALPA